MPIRTKILVTIGLVALSVAFLLKFFEPPQENFRLEKNRVYFIEATYDTAPYTLNYNQQIQVVSALNTANPTDLRSSQPFKVNQLIIGLFDEKKIVVHCYLKDENLLMQTDFWNAGEWLIPTDLLLKNTLIKAVTPNEP